MDAYQKLKYNPATEHIADKFGELNLEAVKKEWKKLISSNRIQKSKLPNIVYLNEDGWKASIQLRTMIAMIKQDNTNNE